MLQTFTHVQCKTTWLWPLVPLEFWCHFYGCVYNGNNHCAWALVDIPVLAACRMFVTLTYFSGLSSQKSSVTQRLSIWTSHQGRVVQRPISANPGLNFNPGLFFFSSIAFSRTIFSILFRVANHQIIEKKNLTEFAFYAFKSEFKFCTNRGLS